MRISSLQIFNVARHSLSDANKGMANTQEQMSSGQRILKPSDDPVASTKILHITDDLKSIDQYLKNIDIAQNGLDLEESILGGVNNIIQRMQELAVSAGNTASLTASDYQAMANEVGSRLDEVVSVLNTRDANGDYLFGGYKSTSEPFSGSSDVGFCYHGDEGQKRIKIANNSTIEANDSGKSLFVDVKSANNTVQTSANPANTSSPPVKISMGQVIDQDTYDAFYPKDIVITFNPESASGKNFTATERDSGRILVENQDYTPGEQIELEGVSFRVSGNPVPGDRLFVDSTEKQGLLTTLSRFKEALESYDGSTGSKDEISGVVASTLDNLSNAQDNVLNGMTRIGARINTLDSTRDLHHDTEQVSKQVLSQLRDVDYAEAATRLSQQTLILQAAQQSFIRVSQLTLFARM